MTELTEGRKTEQSVIWRIEPTEGRKTELTEGYRKTEPTEGRKREQSLI